MNANANFARDWDPDDIDPTKTFKTIIQENIVQAFDAQFEERDGAIISLTPAGIKITIFERKTYLIPWKDGEMWLRPTIMISGIHPFEGLKSSIPKIRIAMEDLFNKEIAEAKENGEYDDKDGDE